MRAWLLNIVISIFNIMEWTTGKSIWINTAQPCGVEQTDVITEDDEKVACVDAKFDDEVVSTIQPFIQYTLVTMLVFQVCLNIAIYKWRWLADWILFENRIFWLLSNCIPSNDFLVTDLSLLEWHFQAFALFYTDNGA